MSIYLCWTRSEWTHVNYVGCVCVCINKPWEEGVVKCRLGILALVVEIFCLSDAVVTFSSVVSEIGMIIVSVCTVETIT